MKNNNLIQLPNNLEIAYIHQYEAEYLYNEIFVQQTYLKHDIKLTNEMLVFDIGANIGMFSLYIKQMCPTATIYAFEPSHTTFQVLNYNMNKYHLGSAFPWAVSDINGKKEFIHYSNSTVFSGLYTDKTLDEGRIKAIATNVVTNELKEEHSEIIKKYVDVLTQDRVQTICETVETKKLSTLISDLNIKKIDLLKIDAEGSEFDILFNTDDRDWSKIKQIVLECHSNDERKYKKLLSLLKQKQFSIMRENETLLDKTGLINLYCYKK